MLRWIEQAWSRITAESITNTWNLVGLHSYNAGGADVLGDSTIKTTDFTVL